MSQQSMILGSVNKHFSLTCDSAGSTDETRAVSLEGLCALPCWLRTVVMGVAVAAAGVLLLFGSPVYCVFG